MALHPGSYPGIERGDGLDHGVDASMPEVRASIIERRYSSMLSLSSSSVASGRRGSRFLTICWISYTFVFAHSRSLGGVTGCQLQSIATVIGRWSESWCEFGSTLQLIVRDAMSAEAKFKSIVDSPSFHLCVDVPGTVSSWTWKFSIIVSRAGRLVLYT